jgi:two-component system, cell cycle sensor histidine kinase and response regulator CckA
MTHAQPEKSLSELIAELRSYQAELETQNEALRYSRIAAEGASERFESLFSKVPLALMVIDEFGMVVQSNTMALRWFRPLENDAPLNFLLPMVEASHVARVQACFEQARQTGASDVNEVVFYRGSQGFLTGDLQMAQIEYSQDEGAHFICAIVDQGPLLAERLALRNSAQALQQRNQELHLSQNRMSAIINSSLDAILCIDSGQTITVFNPAAAALFQCEAYLALGTSLSRFLPDCSHVLQATEQASQALLGEMSGNTAQGTALALEVSVTRERLAAGDVITVFARDLTQRKAMEAQRNELEAQLRESHKMQAVGTMAGGIAHDFNNILSAILGNAELAKNDVPEHSSARVSLVEIEKAGRRARDLVRQILTFSRNESTQKIPIRIDHVVLETVRLLQVTLPAGIELAVQIDEPAPLVLADVIQVEQAVLNLCTNAIHAIGQQPGNIRIYLSRETLEGSAPERLGLPNGRYACLSVSDSGCGIDAVTLERIFEPFFTTKQVGQGTGLGLAVVHGVMRTHLGAIDVQSKPGQGSVFTLYFPALTDEVPSAPEPVAASPVLGLSPSGNDKHVMYIDDDQALVFLIERALGRRGFRVSTFTEPELALQALRANPQAYDLLVTDYNMPGISGVDVLRQTREIRPDLPVALASGYVTPEIEQTALAAGARALIYKPNDVSELCDTMQRLIQDKP